MPLPVNPSNANLILLRLADIFKTVVLPGVGQVTDAYDTQPADTASANVPFGVIEAVGKRGKVTYGAGLKIMHTPLNLVLAVALWQAETRLQINLSNTLAWRDAVLSTFALHMQLSPANASGNPDYTPFVVVAAIEDWSSGVTRRQLGTAEYACLEFGYDVVEHPTFPVAA